MSLCFSLALAGPAQAASVFFGNVPAAGWHVDGQVFATLQVGNTVYVGGTFSNAVAADGTLVARKNLVAFNMDTGALLTSFNVEAGATVRALATDGQSLYVGGVFAQLGGVSRSRLGKLNLATGAVDPTFNPAFDDTVRAIQVDGSNLIVGGAFLNSGTVAKSRLAKVDKTTGALVSGFTASANGIVYSLKLSPVSRLVYVGGAFTTLSGTNRNGLGSVNADTGALAGTYFASSAKPTYAIDTNEDGTVVFASGGSSTNYTGAWNASTGVRNWQVVTDGDNQAMDYYNGVVYFGFHDGYQGNSSIKLLAVDALNGSLISGFRPTFDSFWGVWSVNVTARGLVVGGDFTTVGGVAATGFARFPATSDPPAQQPTALTLLGTNSQWSYWDQGSTPAGWNTTGFADSAWPKGLPRLGYGDTFDTTVIGYGPSSTNKYITSYFRAHTSLSALPDGANLYLSVDDGAVVYVNGTEAVRRNLPTGAITGSSLATVEVSGGQETAMTTYSISPSLFHLGDNTIAVEVHQFSATSADLGLDLKLDGLYNQTPPPADKAPIASFTASMAHLAGSFDASAASDPDGSVVAYYWDFGDGTTGTGKTASHTYAVPGTYTVGLTVQDDQGALGSTSQQVNATSTTNNVIAYGSSWKWYFNTAAPAANWNTPGFTASGWNSGNGVLGYGSSSVVTTIDQWAANTANRPKAAYFTQTFSVANQAAVKALQITTLVNDGSVVYVNGTEVARSNMPAGAVTNQTYASSARSAATAAAAPLVIDVPTALLVTGTNVISQESHLNYRSSPDLTFDLQASLTTG